MRAFIVGTAILISASIGTSAHSDAWNYTALGDSFATGYLATSSYVPRFAGYLQSDNGVPVTLYNLGQNGWTSTQLLAAFTGKQSTFPTAVQEADVVTWDIGTNDFRLARDKYQGGKKCGGNDNQDCLRSMVTTFDANWDAIIGQILSRRALTITIVRTMDLYYPWVAEDQATNSIADSKETGPAKGNDFAVLGYYLNQMNAHIASSCGGYGIPVAQVHNAFNGPSGNQDPAASGYLASDGLHPNDVGHEIIAQAFRSLGYAPLR